MNLTLKADKRSIADLIKDLNRNTYLLPTFQRDYVWDEEDIKEFVDSLIKGYPVGSIILWKPSRKIYKDDPFSKPLIGEKDFERDVYYVIDGQQRLTTLLLMFNNWSIRREGEEIRRIPISIHIGGIDNYKLYKSERYINIYNALRLVGGSPIFDPEAFVELSGRLDRQVFNHLCEIANRILSYEIPMYILETNGEDERIYSSMAEAFVRVNKMGVKIGNVEMILSFLAGEIRGSFKNDIVSIYRDLESFRIDLQPIIRSVLSEFSIKQSDIKVDRFKKIVERIQSESSRKEKIGKMKKALELTVEFLRNRLGIQDTRILPSQIPIITIAKYFSSNDIVNLNQISPETAKLIESWFILVSFNGYYSSQTDTKLEEDLKVVSNSESFPFDDLLKNIRKRKQPTKISKNDLENGLKINVLRGRVGKSYLFLLYLLLIKNDAGDWAGKRLKERSFDDLDKHHIFPREFLKSNLEIDEDRDIYINNIGNITFVDKRVDAEIGDTPPHEYLPRYEIYLDKHFIPKDGNLWKIETYEAFLKARIDIIYSKCRELYPDIFT